MHHRRVNWHDTGPYRTRHQNKFLRECVDKNSIHKNCMREYKSVVRNEQTDNSFTYIIIQFELRHERLTAYTVDKFSLYGSKVIEGRWEEDILVAGWSCDFIKLLCVCIGDSNCQDTDTCRETDTGVLDIGPLLYQLFIQFFDTVKVIIGNTIWRLYNDYIRPRARAILEGGATLSWALPSVIRTRTWGTSCLIPSDSWNSSCKT